MSKGTSSGIGTAEPASTTTSSVKVPVPAKPKTLGRAAGSWACRRS